MAARRSHRDLRLQFADETELRGGSDASPSLETRDPRWVLVGLMCIRSEWPTWRSTASAGTRIRAEIPAARRRTSPVWTVRRGDAAEECSGGELGSAVQPSGSRSHGLPGRRSSRRRVRVHATGAADGHRARGPPGRPVAAVPDRVGRRPHDELHAGRGRAARRAQASRHNELTRDSASLAPLRTTRPRRSIGPSPGE